jgi:hypothetical protein
MEIQVNVSRKALAVLCAALTGLGLWYWLVQRTTPSGEAAAATTAIETSASPSRDRVPHAGDVKSNAAKSAVASATDYAKAFRESTDYRRFILTALPAAQSGDADAAYYVSAALAYCDETNRFFFKRRDKTFSLDEAIADRARFPWPNYTEAIRRADRRCHDVNAAKDPGWGTANQWLAKAAEAGQPVAQVQTAAAAFDEFARTDTTEVPKSGPPGGIRNLSDARALTRVALERNNPEVVFNVSFLLALFRPDIDQSEYRRESLIWQYAACLRGLDCSANADWYFQMCLADPGCLSGDNGLDYLRRSAESVNVYDIEQKARELSAKIDAQAWSELGFGE